MSVKEKSTTVWTKKKIEFLEENFNTMSLPKLSNHLGISVYFIRKKANELGFEDKKSSSAWSDEEIEILRKYYPSMGTDCKKYLKNRTEPAIRMAASKYNIKSDYNFGAWTPEELEILKTQYPLIGTRCSEQLPDRTIKTIQTKASILGIKYNGAKNLENLWLDEEIEILKKHYPEMGVKCAELFPERINQIDGTVLPRRSDGSIIAMAYRLGVKKKIIWSQEELDILVEYYPSEGIGCKERLPKKSKRCIELKAKELDLKKKDSYDHWLDGELRLLRKAYPKMGKKCVELFPNRTSDAIIAKAARMNLKVKKKYDKTT